MKLTTRGKWLIGIAAAVAAYVMFGPQGSDSVEPARAPTRATHGPQTTTASTSSAAPVAPTLLAPAPRFVGEGSATLDRSGSGT